MSTITDNMGLTKWDSLNDSFSHAQLAANFQALDEHDHTESKGVQIPAGGIAPLAVGPGNLQDGTFTTEKIADDAVTSAKLADGAVTAAHIASGAAIPDSKLASANNDVYRLVHKANARGVDLATGTTYILGVGAFVASATNTASPIDSFYFDNADYDTNSLTPMLRLRAQLFTNATAPTSTFTVGLYPVDSVVGNADNQNFTVGTVVSGSTVAFAAPTLSTRNQSVTANFAIPADGYYVLGVAVSVATMVADSAVTISGQLQSVHV